MSVALGTGVIALCAIVLQFLGSGSVTCAGRGAIMCLFA
ncbi:hypothetical protein A2U01_0027357, partial [Trifolium medium]|nr:hypothetical protein [Trifolium medium]